jgi:hypothetical protein
LPSLSVTQPFSHLFHIFVYFFFPLSSWLTLLYLALNSVLFTPYSPLRHV